MSGDFYKLTFAPTFKVGDVFDIKARPEIRFFVTWMNWDKDLDRYAINDDFGSKGFTAGGNWNFGVQTEIWFLIHQPWHLFPGAAHSACPGYRTTDR
ncbi:maltoporin [Klebsiella oxytoca]|nr:maltoporin [Klebsiella oxytoca]